MSGNNVTINDLATSHAASVPGGDALLVWSATGSSSYQALATQMAAAVYSVSVTLTNQTTATTVGAAGVVTALPSAPLGYLVVSVNGTSVKLPYYTV